MREATIRKFMRFKQLRERNLSINKALQGAGLSKSTYSRYKNQLDEILEKAEGSLADVASVEVKNLEKRLDEVLANHCKRIVKLERALRGLELPFSGLEKALAEHKCPECGANLRLVVRVCCSKCDYTTLWTYRPKKR